MERQKRILIIGAGASGMMAAAAAAQAGAKVTLLDHAERPGSKLLLTGNGRCNLTNTDPELWRRFHSSSPEALERCCRTLGERMDSEALRAFFMDIGLPTVQKEGYVYPLSNSARSVLSVLDRELGRLGVKRKYAQQVTGIRREEKSGLWFADTPTYSYEGDALILCCGSRAMPSTGSDGSGYELARMAGHDIIKPLPSLTGLICRGKETALLAGCRCTGRVTVRDLKTGSERSDTGQIQFTGEGISGIVAFQVSGFVSESLSLGHEVEALLDLLPDWSGETAAAFFEGQFARPDTAGAGAERMLEGLFPEKIAAYVAKKWKKLPGQVTGQAAAGMVKAMPFRIAAVRGFEQAQVCAGGVCLEQINPDTFESALARGLYFAGEILDSDGPCGGYNLQWAWSSGYVAGRACAGAC